ncbi:type II toxin-antitoxin system HipA family toxin [Sediminibacterium ginsengisoli]|uniref:Serine/threonine-protein kinase HipA n=1 Tax=Sediminibacterium ginsengisoli TaxID=413434 RepID=A0A1T4RT73_9BACT|nr:HipA domain-containing protein [Sediminibacterium ginsengisoli]SKA18791.1 serine/threonine-protein kinase HipA [Sediminibacterium ginsengisoli]
MATNTDIYVYADWKGLTKPMGIGVLTARQAKAKKAFSFAYNKEWLDAFAPLTLDPDIAYYPGPQYPTRNKENFGVFQDSMPDTWGRTLMKRREAQNAREEDRAPRTLYDIDFLLGVYDESRMGALRFKTEPDGPFLDNNAASPTPHWSHIRELQYAAQIIEADKDDEDIKKWIALLMAPGSSLGGARPKANILDDQRHPWIAKFPSGADTIDKAAWEYLAYLLAKDAGIYMSDSRIEHIAGKHHTFFTKRFDRSNSERIHFASAMTLTGNSEDTIKDNPGSYLDIAEAIQNYGANINADLEQLWRRMVFNIAISNTDDHYRNHGFIVIGNGWHLSPAYDINPSVDKNGLSLNIDMDDNTLDFGLAKSVGKFFRLNNLQMDKIIAEVTAAVKNWKTIAAKIGISRLEHEQMAGAFMV